jgi:hypothetical protein
MEVVEAQDTVVDLPSRLARAYDFDHLSERMAGVPNILGRGCRSIKSRW